jgi:hypothetical protein
MYRDKRERDYYVDMQMILLSIFPLNDGVPASTVALKTTRMMKSLQLAAEGTDLFESDQEAVEDSDDAGVCGGSSKHPGLCWILHGEEA